MHIYKKKAHDFSKPPELRCSFCGKKQNQVKLLVAGPAVYICNECVDICDEIMADSDASERLCHRPAGQTPDEATPPCSFCQTVLPGARMLLVAERGQLCPDCLEATRSAIKALGDR